MKKDTISKEIIKEIVKNISKYLLKIDIKTIKFLETEKQRIESTRADIVAKVNNKFILHLEIQNNNDLNMPQRMLRYWLDISKTSQLPIIQYVIYIGKEKLKMQSFLVKDEVRYSYHLIDLKNLDCNYFLEQKTPEAVILAILCDFKDKNPKDVVKGTSKDYLWLIESKDSVRFR